MSELWVVEVLEWGVVIREWCCARHKSQPVVYLYIYCTCTTHLPWRAVRVQCSRWGNTRASERQPTTPPEYNIICSCSLVINSSRIRYYKNYEQCEWMVFLSPYSLPIWYEEGNPVGVSSVKRVHAVTQGTLVVVKGWQFQWYPDNSRTWT